MKKMKTKIKSNYSPQDKPAFTLAEVLITLGIIGIVAAMTIPTLLSTYKKKVVETRMARFYSTFNQAIELSQIDNGSYMTWEFPYETADEVQEWYDTYFKPYIKVLKSEVVLVGKVYRIVVYMPDGSAVIMGNASSWLFIPEIKDCEMTQYTEATQYVKESGFYLDDATSGTKWFTFTFSPKSTNKYLLGRALVPYTPAAWDGTIDYLKNDATLGCNTSATRERAYCAKWIQLNNWKIPEDYPFKF